MKEETPSVLARLEEASRGLTFLSEIDAPIEPCVFAGRARPTRGKGVVLEALARDPQTPVQTPQLSNFFAPVTREESWHNDEERATVQRFQALVRTLKETLTDPIVLKIGGPRSAVYVVGRANTGELAGVKTTVVET
jgi:hypothetical protein